MSDLGPYVYIEGDNSTETDTKTGNIDNHSRSIALEQSVIIFISFFFSFFFLFFFLGGGWGRGALTGLMGIQPRTQLPHRFKHLVACSFVLVSKGT